LKSWLGTKFLPAAAVLMAALSQPAEANAASVGGGKASGTFFYGGTGIPPLTAQCAPTNFTLSGSSDAFVLLNTAIVGYVGPTNVSGSGSSACESVSNGGGPITLTLAGTGPLQSTINCTNLSGGWTRTGTDVSADVGGTCNINDFTDPVNLIFHGTWQPDGAGAGVITPIASASFSGVFVVPPA
jgi:hypothetical protein